MPRTKLQNRVQELSRPQVPPPNYVSELFNRYRKAQKISSDDLGAALGVSGSAVRHALSRPVSAWTVEDMSKYCIALKCPLSDALQAAAASMGVKA